MTNKQPLVSIIIPTRNSEKLLEKCLISLRNQTYKKIELNIIDGASKDRTIQIAKKYKTRIINNPLLLADPAVNIGIKKAKGDLLMIIAIDNIFKERNAIETIVEVFKNNKVYAAYPIQSSIKSDSIFSKYVNRFTDPFNHFVYGDAANTRSFFRVYKTLEHNKIFDIYDFSSNATKPLLALAQGFTLRKGFVREKNDDWDDCMPILDLISDNKKMAYLHSVILYHHTIRDLNHFIRKQQWATQNALTKKNYGISHRQQILSSTQKLKIKLWPFYAVSFIFPFIRSLKGVYVEKEILWLLHPVMCIISFYGSISAILLMKLNSNKKIIRQ